MKTKFLFLTVLLFLSGCSLIWSPTATVKKFIASAEKGDVDTMTSLFSGKAKETMGIEKIRSNNQNFSDMVRKVITGNAQLKMNQINQSINGDTARVTFIYQGKGPDNSMGMGFDLSKENGAWKIDNIGSRESEGRGEVSNASPGSSPQELIEPPPPPSANSPSSGPSPLSSGRAPISGGVLNGKAISLPQPVYPPVANAAKASGTVVVHVIIDENGNVTSAQAVSGHPLLQAAAVAAARNAKFSPTKLSGQPVKVSGVITYKFSYE